MRALTIHNYWAWAIAAGHKRFENRRWSTSYRGDVAIHSGLSRRSLQASYQFCRDRGVDPPDIDDLVFGSVLCVAELVDVIACDQSESMFPDDRLDEWAFGPQCLVFQNVRVLREPLELIGKLGLFEVGETDASKIYKRLA